VQVQETNEKKERLRIIEGLSLCNDQAELDTFLEMIPNIADYDLTKEIQDKRDSFKSGSKKREWKPGDKPVMP